MTPNNLRRATWWCVFTGALVASAVHSRQSDATVIAQHFDLADDWSGVNNPNGAWALYKAPDTPFNVVQPDWFGNGTNQPAWADASGPNPFPPNPLAPMWAKAIGDVGMLSGDPIYNGFIDAGTVYMHAAEEFRTGTDFSSVVWTSPRTGAIHIDGGVWMAQAFQDRPHYWELRKNGVVLTGGPLTYGDGYDKDHPFLFAAGTGGASATDLAVAQNDEIELLIYKTGSVFTPATFVAADLSILLVPEPRAMLVAGLAIVACAGQCRCRSFGQSRRCLAAFSPRTSTGALRR